MSEVIDDKVDKFHEALMKRYSKKTLVAIAIVIILFVSWYVHTTYKEYDQWSFEPTLSIVRRVIIVDGELRELNISFGTFGFPMSYGANETTMTFWGNVTRNGHSVYWETTDLADAQLQVLYHTKEFLGYIQSRDAINFKMVIHYYYTLIHSPVFHYSAGMVIEPDKERVCEEFDIRNSEWLQDIALNKLAELYRGLRSQKTILVQGKEYPANFYGYGYINESEITGLLPTTLTVSASPSEGSIDVLTRAATTITISGSIDPAISTTIQLELTIEGGGGLSTEVFQLLVTETLSNGEFSTSFVPNSSGVYTIRALFLGNDKYEASSAQISVTMKNNYTTLIMVLAIVTTVVSALYFLRKKRMNTHPK